MNGCVFGSDSVIFDLEDAVSPKEKDSARILVRNTLKTIDYTGVERIVRINSNKSPFWKQDLESIIKAGPDIIMPPKMEGRNDVLEIDEYISQIEERHGLSLNRIKLLPLIETSLGVEKAFEIATASTRIVGIFIGAEDLTANIGAKRTKKAKEILYSRSRIIIAAKAAGVDAIDTPFTDVDDIEGLMNDTIFAKDMGFDGKAVISPKHVDTVNSVFLPTDKEVNYSRRVMETIEKAEMEGKGVVSLDGKMIDAPIVERAKRILSMHKILRKG